MLHNWSRAGLVLGIGLLLIAPLVLKGVGVAVFLIYLWLPFYMLHQYEEHAEGTFLEWYERMMPSIAPFLTERKLLVVNLVTVWLGFLVALYVAFLVRPALGLAAPYLALVNAFMHVGQLLRWRCYNPGLWTALVIFIPGAGYTISALSAAGAAWADNALGLGIAVLVHIFFFALGRGLIGKQL
jgi:hypothetical protein